MSMIAKCAQCDSPLRPYGRDGGSSWCRDCREAERLIAERADLQPKKRPDGRWEIAA
jgi:hypothetical protein